MISTFTFDNALRNQVTHHLRKTPSRDHITRMHKPVQMPRALLDLLAHVIVHLHVEDVRNEVQCILIILHFRVKASEVEPVRQVIFVDLAEVLIATCGYELHSELSAKIL